MTYTKNGWVERVKPPGAAPAINCTLLQANREQLAARHHPMLLLCQSRDCSIRTVSPHQASVFDAFGGLGGHPANVAGGDSNLGRGLWQL